MRNFKNLVVWKKSMILLVEVYKLSRLLPIEEKFNLIVQIRKDVVSISSNIAEGCSKSTDMHFKSFLEISIGSSFELESQLLSITMIFPHLHKDVESIFLLLEEIQKMLNSFIEKLKASS